MPKKKTNDIKKEIKKVVKKKKRKVYFGQEVQDVAVNGIKVLADLMEQLVQTIMDLTEEGLISTDMLKLMVLPMEIMLEVLNRIGADGIKFIIYLKLLNTVLPLATFALNAYNAGLLTSLTLSRALIGLTGVGGGVIAATVGVIVAIFAALFGLIWFPVKRLLKKRKESKENKQNKVG